MSFFASILDKLGLSKVEAAPAAGQETTAAAPSAQPAATPAESAAPVAPTPTPVTVVDVEAHLEKLAAASSQTLNWKQSIVDLLKLLDIDSSIGARKELATELGCPADRMGDSAKMNVWLHKTVLQKIAANGGKVPAELLE